MATEEGPLMNWYFCMLVMGQMMCMGPIGTQEECTTFSKEKMAQITEEQIRERQIIAGCFGTQQEFPLPPDQKKT